MRLVSLSHTSHSSSLTRHWWLVLSLVQVTHMSPSPGLDCWKVVKRVFFFVWLTHKFLPRNISWYFSMISCRDGCTSACWPSSISCHWVSLCEGVSGSRLTSESCPVREKTCFTMSSAVRLHTVCLNTKKCKGNRIRSCQILFEYCFHTSLVCVFKLVEN
jgi:hypothetical protein